MVGRVCHTFILSLLLLSFAERAAAQYPNHVGSIVDVGGVNPTVTGSIFYEPYQIFKSGNYAYVACSNSSTLAIFDVTNPAAPLPVGNLKDGVGGAALAGASSVYVSGNYAYVAAQSTSTLEIVDVTNPAAPVHAGKIVDSGTAGVAPHLFEVHNVFVVGNLCYAVSGDNYLEIIDVSNPAAPTHVGSLFGIGSYNYGGFQAFVVGIYAYAVGPLGNFVVIDVSNPASPVIKATLSSVATSAVYVSGNYAYVTSYTSGPVSSFYIVDISTPTAPVLKGSMSAGSVLWYSPYYLAGHVYFGTNKSVEVVDVSTPATPSIVGSIADGAGNPNGPTLNSVYSVVVAGNYAYSVANSGSSLDILDISIPTAPTKVYSFIDDMGSGPLLNQPVTVAVAGNYAYVGSSASEALEIVDVSNPATPVHKGSLTDGQNGALLEYASSIVVSGNYAYCAVSGAKGGGYFAIYENGLEIVDVSNPAAPVHKGSIVDSGTPGTPPYLNNAQSVFVPPLSIYAYVASYGSNALEIVDITNPAAPVHKGSIVDGGGAPPLLNHPQSVFVSGNYAYVASKGSGSLEVIDVSNPANPTRVGGISVTSPNAVFVSGTLAYVVGGGSVLDIIDVSNPLSPVLKGSLADGGGAPPYLNNGGSIVVSGTFAYVTSNADNSVEVVDISNPAAPIHNSSIVNGAGGALLNYPTSIAISGTNAYVASYYSNALEILALAPAAINITSQPNATYSVCVGASQNISTSANGTTNIAYQWQFSTDGVAPFSDLTNTGGYSNTTTSTISINSTGNFGGGVYRCKISGDFAPIVYTSNANFTINAYPSSPVAPGVSNCGPGSVLITASGGTNGNYIWYDQTNTVIAGQSNSTYTTSSLSANTNFSVAIANGSCVSPTTSVTVTINPVPTSPTSANASNCGSGSVLLSASGGSNGNYVWYDQTNAVIAGQVNSTYTTPSLAVNTNFSVAITNGTCVSPATPITVTIIPIPLAPASANVSNCGSGSVMLSASGGSSGSYVWYDQTNTVIAGQTNSTYTTPTLSVNTNFSVAISSGSCVGPATAITVTINPLPGSPTSANTSNCGSGSVVLSASGTTNGNYVWYDPTNTVIAGQTNSSYTTPVISTTSNYSVAITNGTCVSLPTTVTVTINALPVTPTPQTTSACPGVFTLTVSGGVNGQYVWYTVATGGSPIPGQVNNTYTTPSLSVTTTYYVSINNGTCEGARAAVTATVTCPPPVITPTPLATQVGGTVTLNLVPLITTTNNSLDLTSLQIVVQPISGAKASISSTGVLTLDYTGVAFAGTDQFSIKACDTYGDCTTQQFSIDVAGDIIVYNGVSPTGNNPTFFIEYIDLIPNTKENDVYIFDRWQNQVWHGTNYDNASVVFSGVSSSGTNLPTGVYFYKIDFSSGRKTQTGFISLKR